MFIFYSICGTYYYIDLYSVLYVRIDVYIIIYVGSACPRMPAQKKMPVKIQQL